MKTSILLLAAAGLSGCVVAPAYGPPDVYIAPPVPYVVVQPWAPRFYGDRRDHRHRWR